MTLLGETPPDQDGNVTKRPGSITVRPSGQADVSTWSRGCIARAETGMDGAACHSSKNTRTLREGVGFRSGARTVHRHESFCLAGLLSALLPKLQKLTRGHYAATPFADLPRLHGKATLAQVNVSVGT
jgi:hypothetical protein